MIVMVSNQTGWKTHFLQGRYGGLGLLFPPERLFGPHPHLPWAMDNGAFGAWINKKPWDEGVFEKGLLWASDKTIPPRWVVVPDVVTDPDATLKAWEIWAPRMRDLGFQLALAVQDGMTPDLVRKHTDPDIVFVGGSRLWKLSTRAMWAREFDRVHIARVNGLRDLLDSHRLGVESVDGTGFFRGRRAQLQELVTYLKTYANPDIQDEDTPLFAPLDDGHPRFDFPEPEANEAHPPGRLPVGFS